MVNKLKVKDLVTIGIFFVIYFGVYFAVGMMGIIPVLFLFYPFTGAIITGPIVMLFMAKVPKLWALFIFGMIPSLLIWAAGHSFVVPLFTLICVGIAEYVFRKGGFKSFKYNALAYAVFSCWEVGSLLQMRVVREHYLSMSYKLGMAKEYMATLDRLISYPNLVLVLIGAFIGGLIGAFFGKKMLRKHFEKAGII